MVRSKENVRAGDSSDDSISLNSTVASELQEEYVIDGGILAERTVEGQAQYLVKWDGYDEHCNTWEPEENFQSSDTLKEWLKKKMRVTRGLDEAFDLNAYEERKDKILDAIAARKQRRKEKRRRHGIQVESSSSSLDANSTDSDSPLLPLTPKRGNFTAKDVGNQENQPTTTLRPGVQPQAWADQERRALEAGIVKVEGPWWNDILALYGRNGTVNEDLKRMDERDLKRMASHMRKEFLRSGRNLPFWLTQVFNPVLRGQSLAKETTIVSEKPLNNTASTASLDEADSTTKPLPNSSNPSAPIPTPSRRPSYKGTARIESARPTGLRVALDSSKANPSSPFEQPSAQARALAGLPERSKVAKGYQKIARRRSVPSDGTPVTGASETPSGQTRRHLGARGAGPARPNPAKTKSSSGTRKPKQKAPDGPTNITNRSEGPKLFSNLATLNKIYKKGRNEPAPNLDSLALINPSTGKPPRTLRPASKPSSGDRASNSEPHHDEQPEGAHDTVQHDQGERPASPEVAEEFDRTLPSTFTSVKGKEQDFTTIPHSITFLRESSESSKDDLFRRRADGLLVNGHLKVGLRNPKFYAVRLEVFDWALQQLLLTIKIPPREVHFELQKTCLAAEYRDFLGLEKSGYIGWGYVVPKPESRRQIDSLAGELAGKLSGALCFTRFFNMVVYPVGSDAWAFLDQKLPIVPEGAMLRFVVRQPSAPPLTEEEDQHQSTYWTENLDRYEHIMANAARGTINKSINIVFRELYGIDFRRLVGDKKPAFFLFFIPAGCESYEKDRTRRQNLRLRTSEEHDLTVEFLHENEAEVYSLQDIGSCEVNKSGSWKYFVKQVKSGVVIIHDACIRIDQIQRLAVMLLNPVNVWKISLEPMDQDAKYPHLIRLFPHGAVVLLTESLILYRPHDALRLLMWFRLAILSGNHARTPGTWKLAVRVHVRPWLLDILDLYEDTQTDVFGCGKQVFADIYTNITWLLEREYLPKGGRYPVPDGTACLEEDDETPDDEAPLVAPASLRTMRDRKEWNFEDQKPVIDHDNIKLNDDLLVQWFAEWAIIACENFRRFPVVLGYEPGPTYDSIVERYEKTWGHIEILRPETLYDRYKVTSHADLDAQESERLRQSRERGRKVLARNETLRKKEREEKRASLKRVKRQYRDAGATENQVRDGSRLHLQQSGASWKEINETEIDMDLKEVWYERPRFGLGNDLKRVEDVEAMLAAGDAEEERVRMGDRERAEMGREKVDAWIVESGGEDEGGDGSGEEDLDGEPMDVSLEADVKIKAEEEAEAGIRDGDGAGDDDAGGSRSLSLSAVEDALARSIRLAREFPS